MYRIIGCKKKFKYFDLTDFGFVDDTKNDVTFDLRKKIDESELIKTLRLNNRKYIQKSKYRHIEKGQTILDEFFENRSSSTIEELKKRLFKENKQLKPKKSVRKRRILITPYQRKITDYKDEKYLPDVKYLKRDFYRTKRQKADALELSMKEIPEDEICAMKNYGTAKGYLKHIFMLNDFTFFDKLQIETNKSIPNDSFGYSDVIKCEIARTKLGESKISLFLAKLRSWSELQIDLGVFNKKIPTEKRYLELLYSIGHENIYRFFSFLRDQCYAYDLYGNKIIIWDAHFYKVYHNGSTAKLKYVGKYIDVSPYVKREKTVGIGLLESNIIDWKYGLPIHYDSFTAKTNDNLIFRKTFEDYIKIGLPKPEVVLSDGGPKGFESYKIVSGYEIAPLIAAPDNAAGYVIRTPKGRLFYGDHTPPEFHWILDDVFDNRTGIERMYGYDILVYNRYRAFTRTKSMEKIFIGIHNIVHLLTALTSYKFNRFDLIKRPTAYARVFEQKEAMRIGLDVLKRDREISILEMQIPPQVKIEA